MKFTMGDAYKYHDIEDKSKGGDSGKEGRVGVRGGWVRKEEKQEQAKEFRFILPVVNVFGILMGISRNL